MTKHGGGLPPETAREQLGEVMEYGRLNDPFPLFTWLRRNNRVADAGAMKLITRYDDLVDCYRDPRFSRHRSAVAESLAHAHHGEPDEVLKQARLASVSMMINQDDPDHRRIRRILEVAFKPSRVTGWKARIDIIVDDLIARVQDKDEFDFLAELAFPLPERIICELMGVPHEDHGLWRVWSEAVVSAARTHTPSAEKMAEVDQAHRSFYLYFKDLVAERKKNLGDDLVSIMIRAESEGERLSEVELLGALQMLIEAGHETTANLIGNGMYTLLKNPEQYAMLHADPSLVPDAVEEMLRFSSPARWSLPREAMEDIRIGDAVVPKGCPILIAIDGANRDESVFENPEKFDITRKPNRHVAFAAGPHFCLGNQLARQEAQAMFLAIVTRLRTLELVREPRVKASFVRAFETLIVRQG